MFPDLVLIAAAAEAHPLIDIDNTVFVQLVLFGVIGFALSRLLFRPYLEVRRARHAGIEGAREEALRMDEEARARMADYERKIAAARSEAAKERLKIRAEAQESERQIAAAAQREAQEAIEKARQELRAQADAARAELEPRTEELARTMAMKVLGREVA